MLAGHTKATGIILSLVATFSNYQGAVRTGLDRLDAHSEIFRGKRLGIITNHTAYDSDGTYIVDAFKDMSGVTIAALFSPEHGLWGAEQAGRKTDTQVHPVYRLPIHSLYGKTQKPTPDMLQGVDVLVFDIQDVGARFYTYVYTMSLSMEAAAENGKRFVVLDRPNPITGHHVRGSILEAPLASFVGLHPIPVRHGMTAGELANMFNEQGWLAGGVKADLVVIPMKGWRLAPRHVVRPDRPAFHKALTEYAQPRNRGNLSGPVPFGRNECLRSQGDGQAVQAIRCPLDRFETPGRPAQQTEPAGNALRADSIHSHEFEIQGPGVQRRPNHNHRQRPA